MSSFKRQTNCTVVWKDIPGYLKLFYLPDTLNCIVVSRTSTARNVIKCYVEFKNFLACTQIFRKTINSFVMYISLSVWKNLAPTGRIFVKFYIDGLH